MMTAVYVSASQNTAVENGQNTHKNSFYC